MKILASGHFDPFHPGHVNYLLAAKSLGGQLIVAVDSDEALRCKHPPILCGEDRRSLVESLSFVDLADLSVGLDVSDIIEYRRPDVYAVGPDHLHVESLPEYPTCVKVGCKIVPMSMLKKEEKTSAIAKAKMVYSNRPTVVNAIILRNDDVLIGVRNDGSERTELIGGFVEPGETLEQGLRREVLEETGANVQRLQYFGSWPGVYSDGRILLSAVFICVLDRDPQPTCEVSEFRAVTEVPSNMFAACDAAALGSYLKAKKNSEAST